MLARLLIGQTVAQPDLSGALRAGLGVMLAAVLAVGGLYVVRAVRRWVRREAQPEPFTLQDLREMRARDEITADEFASLRAAMLGHTKAGATVKPPGSSEQTQPPHAAPPGAD